MLKTFLSGMVLIGLLFAQDKSIIVTKIVTEEDSTSEMSVDVTVEDNVLDFSIEKDGQTQIYKFKLDDLKSLESLEGVLENLDIDVDIESLTEKTISMCSRSSFLGVRLQDLTPQLRTYFGLRDGRGVLISEVLEDSPAEKSGLSAGDIIVQINETDINNARELTIAIREYKPEEEVTIRVNRRGRIKKITATLSERDHEMNINTFFGPGHYPKVGKKLKRFKHHLDKHSFPNGFPGATLHEELENFRKDLEALKQEVDALKN